MTTCSSSRKVQLGVERVQAFPALFPVAQPSHREVPEKRDQRPAMLPRGPRTLDSVRVDNRRGGFALAPRIDVSLEQLAQQIPTALPDGDLQIGGTQPLRLARL